MITKFVKQKLSSIGSAMSLCSLSSYACSLCINHIDDNIKLGSIAAFKTWSWQSGHVL